MNWLILYNEKTDKYWRGEAVNVQGTILVRWSCDIHDGPRPSWTGGLKICLSNFGQHAVSQPISPNHQPEDLLHRLGITF